MPSAERIYTVQVLWDETMADGGAKWLAANPRGHLVILAGNGHCHDSAIVGRIKRRGVTDVVSVRPVIDARGRGRRGAREADERLRRRAAPAEVRPGPARQNGTPTPIMPWSAPSVRSSRKNATVRTAASTTR